MEVGSSGLNGQINNESLLPPEESLSIVLPAFNEEANIGKVISDIISYVPGHVKNFDVIVVNDGSTDATLDVINGISKLHPELRIVSHERNKGYGFAIRTGIQLSQKEWILIMDSDGQLRIKDFAPFWHNKQYHNFIIGYRRQRKDNLYRILLAKFGNTLANLSLPERIKDIDCGFKLFKVQDLKRILLTSTGILIHFEILNNLFKEKKKFVQLPVTHFKRIKGQASGGDLTTITNLIGEGINLIFKGEATS